MDRGGHPPHPPEGSRKYDDEGREVEHDAGPSRRSKDGERTVVEETGHTTFRPDVIERKGDIPDVDVGPR